MVWNCLSKFFDHPSEDNIEMDKPNTTVSILQSKRKKSIKALISSEDQNLRPALRIISLEGFQPEPLSKKRANHKPTMERRAIIGYGTFVIKNWIE